MWPCSFGVAKGLAVGLPAGLAQLLIDQLACSGLIQFDRARGRSCRLPQPCPHRRWLLGGGTLQRPQLGSQGHLVGLNLLGQLLPLLLLPQGLLQLGLCVAELLGDGAVIGQEGIELALQPG